MNKAITEGLVLTPPAFSEGLDVWASGDGTPGSDTYAGSGPGAYVPSDQDFAGCLEVVKTGNVQKVRYMGQTPIMPGTYLRVTARLKAVSGALPSVRIAGWAGAEGGSHLPGVDETAPAVQLTGYGEVVEVSAIIGTGRRGGVDMVWTEAAYGHIGLDLTGPNGGVVRIDDIGVEDVTGVFLRDLLAFVDVLDYGAVGDGIADDATAFEAADDAAQGRTVLVPEGIYYLGDHVTFRNRASFEGSVEMPADKRLILQKNFDFPSYLQAFKDEEEAFRKAFQALLNFSDHESLDLGGRRISLSAPVDMQAAEGSKTTFAQQRVIRNGQFQPIAGPAWDDAVVTAQASYSAAKELKLTNVAKIAQIPVGARVEGNGVGREIYVRAKNEGAGELTLSAPLFDAEGTQVFTFTRHRYLLDFSGFDDLSLLVLDGIDFYCNGKASGLMLARQGLSFHVKDCAFTKPKDRGITSPGSGCQGMMIDRCQFRSNESPLTVEQRTTIAFNANANDVKIRDNRVLHFKHFCVLGGSGTMVVGNHWFHGDGEPDGVRKGGIVITSPNPKSVITGNYIDNNFIEWTNEHDASPALGQQFSFGGLTITGNIFTANDVAPWFRWIVVKPYGPGHFLFGFAVTGNVFRTLNGYIDRVEDVDTTYADLNYGRMRNVEFRGNSFHGVTQEVFNPASVTQSRASAERIWVADAQGYLPFGGRVRTVESVTPVGRLEEADGSASYDTPWVDPDYNASDRSFRLVWRTAVRGTVRCLLRMDEPL